MAILTGTGPDQLVTAADLGTMAFQNHDEVQVTDGLVAADEYQKAYTAPKIKPTLNLPFAKMQTFDPRVSFSRSSDAYAYEGESTKAEENLFLFSEQFDNASWARVNATVTPNQDIAPNGSTTADLLVLDTATSASVRQAFSFTAGLPVTISFWVRSANGANQSFELYGNGQSATSGELIATSTWQRFSYTYTALAGTLTVGLKAFSTLPVEVFIWGAQLEQRDTLTDYQRTTDRIIQRYIDTYSLVTSNKPRFKEIDPVTKERKGLLVEEARTNLLTFSNGFDQTVWGKPTVTVTEGVPSPVGVGYKVFENLVTNNSFPMAQSLTVTGAIHTFTIYVKAAERFRVRLSNTANGTRAANFNLKTQDITNVSSDTTANIDKLDNGWFRISVSRLEVAGVTTYGVSILNNDGLSVYTGDGYSGIYISQAQLEVGSFPTSPILTGASAVTRASELPQIIGRNFTDFYKVTGGSACVSFYPANHNVTQVPFTFDDGTNNNRILLLSDKSGSLTDNTSQLVVTTNGTAFVGLTGVPDDPDRKNIYAITFENDNVIFVDDVGNRFFDSPLTLPFVDRLAIGRSTTTPNSSGHISQISYYPQALSADELAFLTRNTSDE